MKKRLLLGFAMMAALAGAAGADVITAVASGKTINDPDTWGQAAPVSGDANTWQTGANVVRGGGAETGSTETFYGQLFEIQTGGQLRNNGARQTLFMQNLTLDGGLLMNYANAGFTIDLGGKTLTLNSGVLKTGDNNDTRNLTVINAALAGSGTIAVNGLSGGFGSSVILDSTVTTKGFSGIFSVSDYGVLDLSAISTADASFGITVSGTGVYKNDASVALTSLIVDGMAFDEGTYTYADFVTAGKGAFIGDNGGTITVIPEPATLGLFTVSSVGLFLFRKISR
jgi:hypothetical protein